MKNVLIIGGGFAGLAAGVSLSEAGYRVSLFEKRPFLGGRAYSFLDRTSGNIVDNGQHLLMGCYKETLSFLEKIGSTKLLDFQKRTCVHFLDPNKTTVLDCPSLPAPIHFLVGLIKLQGISFKDKLNTLKVGQALKKKNLNKLNNLTVDQWLTSLDQSELIKTRFWDPLVIATLNEDPNKASANLFLRVLKDAFTGTQKDSQMVIPKVGLSELYTEQAKKFIESHGGTVHLNTKFSQLLIEEGNCSGALLDNGTIYKADVYISAVPYFSLYKLLPSNLLETQSYFSKLKAIKSSPIISINLWFDRPIMDFKFAGLLQTQVQWIFNKDLTSSTSIKSSNHISAIISAADSLIDYPASKLVELAIKDLKIVLAKTSQAKLIHSLVIKEKWATFSATPLTESLRPVHISPIENLILIGDWTNTGLPATIESAVLSGHRCLPIVNSLF